ncbi:MAG: efflux RND transporter permease subunit [Burkholderiaceae bacterium]
MNLSRPFIDRPIATLLLMVALVLCGALGYALLPVAALPEVSFPSLQVLTSYPGANPETMSANVTAPLERRLGQMAGLQQMNSTSSEALSVITLQFSLGVSLDIAEQEVQQAINAAGKLMPRDLPAPPTYSKINPGDAPILTLALGSDQMALTQVEDIADTRLAQKLATVEGVGKVSLEGGQRRAIVIEGNGQALAAMGRSLETLRTAVGNANQNLPKGSVDAGPQSYGIGGNDQLVTPSEYRHLIVDATAGRTVSMASVARVAEGPETAREGAWSNGTRIIELDIHRQPGANVIEVVDRVRALLPSLQASLPASVRLEVLVDRTESIRASVRDVQWELVSAVALVVMVIFVFLRNVPATLIPALSVPVTLVGTLAVVYALGFSLNNLTLMALTIATGFVVDDAIVVLENIVRHLEAGRGRLEAAREGARQIGFTIVSLSLSLVAVMIPLLFMQGVVGRLFREFALTLSVTVFVSAAVSLTFTPMLCAHLLRGAHAGPGGETGPAWLDRLQRGYVRLLAAVLARPVATMAVVSATIALSAVVLLALPKGLFPQEDTGLLVGLIEADPGASFSAMVDTQARIVDDLRRDPAVEQVSSFVGADPFNLTLNQARLLIRLKPFGTRPDAATVQGRLLRAQAGGAGARLFLHALQDLALDTQGGMTDFRVGLQAGRQRSLSRTRDDLDAALRRDPVYAGLFSQTLQTGEQVTLDFDRATATRLGVTQQQVSDALYDAFGERQVSTIFTPVNQYHVVLKAARHDGPVDRVLDEVFVRTAGGRSVPLSAMVSLSIDPAPLVIARQNQFPYADLSLNLAPGHSLGDAVAHLHAAERGLARDPDVEIVPEGAGRLFDSSLQNGALLALAAAVVVYILMGVLYESLVHPLTILSTLPAATLGALLALWACRLQFDVIALIGIVLLVGIVMKNAIMMIDFALAHERREQCGPREAISMAARLRFRPILMTTVASLVGAVPLAVGSGIGAELRHPMGIAIIGGLVVSQLLTLLSTPVIYLLLHRAGAAVSTRVRRRPSPLSS